MPLVGCTSALVVGEKLELRNLALIPCKNRGGRGERERVRERKEQECSVWPEKDRYY